MPKYSLAQIRQLPERVQDALISADERFVFEIAPELTDGETKPFVDLMYDVFFGALTPEKFIAAAANVVPDAARRQEAVVKTLGLAFLPLADYFGSDVLSLIRAAGGDPVLFRNHAPIREVVSSVLLKAEVELFEEHLMRRLQNILESRIIGARTDDQTLALLTGPTKTSGVGLTAEQSATLLATLVEELALLERRNVVVVKDEEFEKLSVVDAAASAGEDEPIMTAVAPPPPNLPGTMPVAESYTEEIVPPPVKKPALTDAEEIALTARRMAETAHQVRSFRADDVAERQQQAVAAAGLSWPDESLERRFRGMVDMYFRDLRDAIETKSKMTMPITSGGLGMSDQEAEKVMVGLTAAVKSYRDQMDAQVASAKSEFAAAQGERQLSEQEMPTARTPVVEASPVQPVVVPVTAPTPDSTTSPLQKSTTTTPPLRHPTTPPLQNAPITDVRPNPKLLGPVDELRSITLVDFRRLSRDPQEATLKIRDKIDLLAEQSFEARTAGINAWHDSEPNRIYLDTLRRSLDGQPVADVIAAMTAVGQPALNKAEFDAILNLNRQLRF